MVAAATRAGGPAGSSSRAAGTGGEWRRNAAAAPDCRNASAAAAAKSRSFSPATLTARAQRSKRGLYDALENPALYPNEAIERALNDALPSLRLVLDAFGKPNAESKRRLESGKPFDGERAAVALTPFEQKAAAQLSEIAEIDEVQAAAVVRDFCEEAPGPEAGSCWDALREPQLHAILEFFFFERNAGVNTLTILFRICGDSDHRYHQEGSAAIAKLLEGGGNAFFERILDQLRSSFEQEIPNAFLIYRRAALWARANVDAQLGMLETLFLLFYESILCPPATCVRLAQYFQESRFFADQVNAGYFDREAADCAVQVTQLAILVVIETANLEKLPDDLEYSDGVQGKHIWDSPDDFRKMDDLMKTLEPSDVFGPMLLMWSCVVSRVAVALEAANCPERFKSLKPIVLGDQDGPGDSSALFGTRAVELGVFEFLERMLRGTRFSPDVIGYKGIIKGLLMSFAVSFRVNNLSKFEGLVECLAVVLEGHPELGIQYWTYDCLSFARRSILDTARARFPLRAKPLVRLLSALTGDAQTADHSWRYLSALPTFTRKLTQKEMEEHVRLESTPAGRRAVITKDLTLPPRFCAYPFVLREGTVGQPLSTSGDIIQWKYAYPAWKLFVVMLDSYATSVVFGDFDVDSGTVTEVVKLLRALFAHSPTASREFFGGEGKGIASENSDQTMTDVNSNDDSVDVVSAVFLNLNQALLAEQPDVLLIEACLSLLAAAVPVVANQVWTNLTRLPLFAPTENLYTGITAGPRTSLESVQQRLESPVGRYPATLAFLDFVDALLDDALSDASLWQSAGSRGKPDDSRASAEFKAGILRKYLVFIKDAVFPTHNNWRYARLAERFQLGLKIFAIFNRIVRDTTLCRAAEAPVKHPLTVLYRELMDSFLYGGSQYYAASIIHILGNGRSLVTALRREQRRSEVEELEQVLESALIFLGRLLKFRLTKRGIRSPLETALLDRSASRETTEVVSIISLHVLDGNPRIAPAALEVLTLLCTAAAEWKPSPPSLAMFFSSRSDLADTVVAFINIIKDEYQKDEMRAALLNLVALLVETQPALGSLFVNGRLPGKLPPLLTGVRTTGSPSTDVLDPNSVLHPVKQLLRSSYSEVKFGALRVLKALFENRLAYSDICDHLRQLPELWDGLEQTLAVEDDCCRFEHPAVAGDGRLAADQIVALKHLCAAHLTKALVLSVLAMEVFTAMQAQALSAGSARSGCSTASIMSSATARLSPVASTENGLGPANNLATKGHLLPPVNKVIQAIVFGDRGLFRNGLRVSFNQHLYGELLRRAQESRVDLSLARVLKRSDDYNVAGTYGDSFMFDLDAIAAQLEAQSGRSHGKAAAPLVVKQLQSLAARVNHNLSLTDAQHVLLRSWKQLLALAFSPAARALWGSRDVAGVVLGFAMDTAEVLSRIIGTEPVVMAARAQMADLLLFLVERLVAPQNAPGAPTAAAPPPAMLLAAGSSGAGALVGLPFERLSPLLERIQMALKEEDAILVDPVSVQIGHEFQSHLLASMLLLLERLRAFPANDFDGPAGTAVREQCEACLAVVSGAASTALESLGRSRAPKTCEDVDLILALVSELISPPLSADASLWLAQFRDRDLLRCALVGFAAAVDVPRSEPPALALSVLDFLLRAAMTPAAAARLAGRGVVAIFSNNSLSPALQQGQLVSPHFADAADGGAHAAAAATVADGDREVQHAWHRVWCLMLAVLTAMLIHLRRSEPFVADLMGLLRLYSAQFYRDVPSHEHETISTLAADDTERVGHVLSQYLMYYLDTST